MVQIVVLTVPLGVGLGGVVGVGLCVGLGGLVVYSLLQQAGRHVPEVVRDGVEPGGPRY